MSEAPKQLRVFLCHSSHDKPVVRELYMKLCSESWIDPWLDEEKLLPGQDWNVEIEKAVETSHIVLVLLTNNSVNKEGYIQRELRLVFNVASRMPEDTIFVIPLKLEKCQIPRSLEIWQWLNYFPPEERGVAYGKLLASLKKRATGLGIYTEKVHSGKDVELILEDPEVFQPAATSVSGISKQQALSEPIQRSSSKPRDAAIGTKKTDFSNQATVILILLACVVIFISRACIDKYNKSRSVIPTVVLPTATHTMLPPTPTPVIMISTADGMELVYIPSGDLSMGSDQYVDTRPIHVVNLSAFWIDRTEVTNAMYVNFLRNNSYQSQSGVIWFNMFADDAKILHNATTWAVKGGYEKHPVTDVSWFGATAYCSWVGRRLPTEAEWEKAARGPNGNTYPWGNEGPNAKLANYNNIIKTTTDVGIYPPGVSPYGAFDMAGNAWEWVNDWYNIYPGGDPRSSFTFGEKYRVLRGGSWMDLSVNAAYRLRLDPSGANSTTGFRCALDASE